VLYGIERNWLNPNETITIKALVDAGLIQKPRYGLKLLSRVSSPSEARDMRTSPRP
jgi:hypothetical protein